MPAPLSVLLVPGLNCSARLYAEQIPALWRFGPVTVADHTRDDSMEAIAARILAFAPPRFALAAFGTTTPVESSPNTPPPMPWHSHGSPSAASWRLMHVSVVVLQ